MADSSTRVLITPTFRMSFPNLVKPKAFQDRGKKTYSLEMIFGPEDLEKFKLWDDDKGDFLAMDIRRVCTQVAKEAWPDMSVKEAVASGVLGWPIKNGDKHADKREANGKKGNDHYRGNHVINAKANEEYPPRLYYKEGKERKQIARGTDAGDQRANQLFYGGASCFAELTVKAQETPQGKFITFYVNAVRFVKDGERFGGGSLMDRFDGVQGGETDYDPTEGMDDEIPF